MKTYLPLARGAELANYSPEQLRLLCDGGRLDCRQVDGEWFVAEEDLVDTLAALDPALVRREVDEIAAWRQRERQLAATANTGLALNRALAIVMTMFLLLFGIWGFSEYLSTPAGGRMVWQLRAAPQAARLALAEFRVPDPGGSLAAAGTALEATAAPLTNLPGAVADSLALVSARLTHNLNALLGR